MQTINQLNEQIQILQNSDLAHLSMVIDVPSSDEIDHNRGKGVKTKRYLNYFNERRNWDDNIRRKLFGRNKAAKIKAAKWRGAGVQCHQFGQSAKLQGNTRS